jgi:hypothetical protein
MKRLQPFYLAAALLLGGTASLAQDNQPPQPYQPGQPVPGSYRDPTYRRHLGFYIRPDLGFGYMNSNEHAVRIRPAVHVLFHARERVSVDDGGAHEAARQQWKY